MTKINTIITGHGNFASGIGSSLKLLSGEHDEITLVDFTESMSELDLGEKLADSLQQDIPTLYFTDLAGGTPFKEAIKISIDKPDVEVVSGCNLAALLETMFNDYDNVQASFDYFSTEIKRITDGPLVKFLHNFFSSLVGCWKSIHQPRFKVR